MGKIVEYQVHVLEDGDYLDLYGDGYLTETAAVSEAARLNKLETEEGITYRACRVTSEYI